MRAPSTILQPQALPLYGGTSAHELLVALFGFGAPVFGVLVRATWTRPFRREFREGVARMRLPRASSPGTASAKSDAAPARRCRADPVGNAARASALTILFRADPSLWDGRYANNPWLQELPRPLTKLVWDNPLLIAPALAQQMDLKNGDCVRLSVGRASVVAPVWLMPGQAPDCITALLGSGRRAAGSIGNRVGVDFYPLDRH